MGRTSHPNSTISRVSGKQHGGRRCHVESESPLVAWVLHTVQPWYVPAGKGRCRPSLWQHHVEAPSIHSSGASPNQKHHFLLANFSFEVRFRVRSCVHRFPTSTMVNREHELLIARDYVSEPIKMALCGDQGSTGIYSLETLVDRQFERYPFVVPCNFPELSKGLPSCGCSPTFFPTFWCLL